MNATNKLEEINRFRRTTGCGLREAKDAVERYGSCDAAIAALDPKNANANSTDPYARAVADRERWHAKSSEYRNGLQVIISLLDRSNDPLALQIVQMATEAKESGDKL